MTLKLIDLIEQSGVALGDFKIHCAIDNKRSEWRPLHAYYAGTFELGQSQQSQKNFECENVVSLINLSNSRRWLYVGAYRVDGVRGASGWNGFVYKLTRLPGLDHLDGRVIIDFPKTFRASYLIGRKHRDALIVNSIREERLSIADFPGFNGVRLSFDMLASIIRQDYPSWRAALANVAGVYVIVDTESGYQYVGSAYGGVGLWQRWTAYVKTGHGGNKELRELLKTEGSDYAKNFQFSLVEVCDVNASSDYIIARESHWKDVLMTREFGLNWN
jgi:hypothetical protein